MKIYLDNAATTAIDPQVLDEIVLVTKNNFANPSSVHAAGVEAFGVLSRAREKIAKSVGAHQNEIIFTGSGTEANNLALKGLFFSNFPDKNHIITTKIEHDCISNTCEWLKEIGAEVTYLGVDHEGFVNPIDLENAITNKTFLVSIIHGNNEIGTIQNLRELGKICRSKNVLFHSDACQSYTKVSINVEESNLDLLTINAHKIHGPRGVGALYIRKGVRLTPLLHGGGQEFGVRSSTENLAGIAGFAKAVEIADSKNVSKMEKMRDDMIEKLLKIDGIVLNGPKGKQRLCNNINISFFMKEGELIQQDLSKNDIYVSTGSACSSGSKDVSHVMKAIKSPMDYLHGNIRISISKYTTQKELDTTLEDVKKIVKGKQY